MTGSHLRASLEEWQSGEFLSRRYPVLKIGAVFAAAPAPKEPIYMTTTASSQSGLFAQLEPLLAHRAVLITVSKLDGDQLQVNICPRQLKGG